MMNRIVSMSSLFAALVSAALFLAAGYSVMTGHIGEMDGVFAMSGCLMAAGLFAYRSSDPAWLEAASIVKSR